MIPFDVDAFSELAGQAVGGAAMADDGYAVFIGERAIVFTVKPTLLSREETMDLRGKLRRAQARTEASMRTLDRLDGTSLTREESAFQFAAFGERPAHEEVAEPKPTLAEIRAAVEADEAAIPEAAPLSHLLHSNPFDWQEGAL